MLLIDMTSEALELSAGAAAMFQGSAMVWLAALSSFLLLMAIGRWRGQPEGLALAFYIALGIGLHNFGEGLAIGGAFAAGSAGSPPTASATARSRLSAISRRR